MTSTHPGNIHGGSAEKAETQRTMEVQNATSGAKDPIFTQLWSQSLNSRVCQTARGALRGAVWAIIR